MITYSISNETNIQEIPHTDNINLFCQFFIHSDKKRQAEILECLKLNLKNKYITKIFLLNERIYTNEELGVLENTKIEQVNIGHRLKFRDVFEYINDNNIKGYNVIINSDIFFKKNIKNLFKSDIHISKKMYALLRFEYYVSNPEKTHIFGPRGDSQDTWIIHSNFNIGKKECKLFDFEFGRPGCDNKMIYLMSLLNYEVINDPYFIQSFHIHETNIRNYTNKDLVPPPYEYLLPKRDANTFFELNPQMTIKYENKYNHKISNTKLFNYINKKLSENNHFIIPRISTIETEYAVYSLLLTMPEYSKNYEEIKQFLNSRVNVMKNNAGILLTSDKSIKKYSRLYLEAFNKCELYGAWAPFDSVYNSIGFCHKMLDNILQTKETIYPEAYDIYHYIYGQPWTYALKGKRLLMVSNFAESIKEKIATRKEIYGVDLFPECEIITIRPPQTQGSEPSEEFDVELGKFTKELDKIKNDYDIALVSCGGYGTLVCSHIFTSGKSAIQIGGVLQMYWGILGTRWFKDRPDIIKLFLNKSWTRPKEIEKPKDYNLIENGCYW